jgi:hypothetical protein
MKDLLQTCKKIKKKSLPNGINSWQEDSLLNAVTN